MSICRLVAPPFLVPLRQQGIYLCEMGCICTEKGLHQPFNMTQEPHGLFNVKFLDPADLAASNCFRPWNFQPPGTSDTGPSEREGCTIERYRFFIFRTWNCPNVDWVATMQNPESFHDSPVLPDRLDQWRGQTSHVSVHKYVVTATSPWSKSASPWKCCCNFFSKRSLTSWGTKRTSGEHTGMPIITSWIHIYIYIIYMCVCVLMYVIWK